jgi:predicted DNA-binding WGR domain protein
MTRRFEFVSDTSAKFWEITVAGCDVSVRYGRIGADGQSQSKSFGTAEAADRHAEKVIAEKTRKGYVECVVR